MSKNNDDNHPHCDNTISEHESDEVIHSKDSSDHDSRVKGVIDWKNPPLFKPTKVRVQAYWKFVSLVAPYVDESKQWKTSDAVCAFCTMCKCKISYSTGNPKNLKRHMEKFHPTDLEENLKRKQPQGKSIQHFYSKKIKASLRPASNADQLKGEAILVKWVAESLRPFTIVEDSGFRELVQFLCNLNKEFSVPGRQKLRSQLVLFAEMLREKIVEKIDKDVKFFSATTDIWSSRTMESFMALTLHSLTEDFHPINFTLAVEPLRGRHTASFIHKSLQQQFDSWRLNKEFLVVMNRDYASNVIKIFYHLNRYTSHLNDCVSLFIFSFCNTVIYSSQPKTCPKKFFGGLRPPNPPYVR